MTYIQCKKCKAKLKIEANDTMPGCREMEEAYCPICHELVDKVFTSGFPTVRIVKEKYYNLLFSLLTNHFI